MSGTPLPPSLSFSTKSSPSKSSPYKLSPLISSPRKRPRSQTDEEVLRKAVFGPVKETFNKFVDKGVLLNFRGGDIENPQVWAWPLDENGQRIHWSELHEAFRKYDIPIPYCACYTQEISDRRLNYSYHIRVCVKDGIFHGDVICGCRKQKKGCSLFVSMTDLYDKRQLQCVQYPLRTELGEGLSNFDSEDIFSSDMSDTEGAPEIPPFMTPIRKSGFSRRNHRRPKDSSPSRASISSVSSQPPPYDLFSTSSVLPTSSSKELITSTAVMSQTSETSRPFAGDIASPSNQKTSPSSPPLSPNSLFGAYTDDTALTLFQLQLILNGLSSPGGITAELFQRAFVFCDCGRWFNRDYFNTVHSDTCLCYTPNTNLTTLMSARSSFPFPPLNPFPTVTSRRHSPSPPPIEIPEQHFGNFNTTTGLQRPLTPVMTRWNSNVSNNNVEDPGIVMQRTLPPLPADTSDYRVVFPTLPPSLRQRAEIGQLHSEHYSLSSFSLTSTPVDSLSPFSQL